jgi:hypothetical protein
MSMKAPYAMEKPRFDTIAGVYARPRTKRVFLQKPGDICIVEARPDFTFLIKDTVSPEGERPFSGFGFLFGEDKEAPDIESVAKSFAGGSIPVLSQTAILDDMTFTLTSFCVDRALRLRLEAANTHPAQKKTAIVHFSTIQASLGDLYEHPNEDYVPYRADSLPWLSPLAVRLDGRDLMLGDAARAFLVAAEGFEARSAGPLVTLEAVIPPGGRAAMEWAVPYGPAGRRPEKSWDEALRETLGYWAAQLARGARLKTPDAVVNRLFDTLRLSSLQMLGAKKDSGAFYPGQGGMSPFGTVYGMEASCWVPVLDRLGFHDEARRVMAYLIITQDGSPGPEGDISDPSGSFRPHIHWMCETGAALKLLCSHALYTQDREWFESIASRLMAACEFIARERARTKELYAAGEPGHGLLPAGRPHDWPDYGQFLFSDAYTWEGLGIAAEAFTAFGHPSGPALRAEADDYRRCILDSFKKCIHPYPGEPGRLWFSNEVHTPAGKEVGSYGADGPICLVQAGLISEDDPIIGQIELDAARRGFMTPLFALVMGGMEDAELAALQRRHAGGDYDLIYVTVGESTWHRVFMLSGQRERALAYFYSTLAYATSYDIGVAHERFCPQLPWLLPWQPNASANGRILEMMASCVCLERGDCLYLLAGVPEEWLDSSVSLKDYAIRGGKVSVAVSRRDEKLLEVETVLSGAVAGMLPKNVVYCLPEGWTPKGDAEPAEGGKGWWRAPLAEKNSMAFTC